MAEKSENKQLDRRNFIKYAAGTAAAAPLAGLVASNLAYAQPGGGPGGTPPGGDTDPPNDNDDSGTGDSSYSTGEDLVGTVWAAGGTAALTIDFPPESPFTESLGTVCQATSAYTLGPCYFSPDQYRQDISDGQLGVPMLLCMKLVDGNCNPIAGADIDIWHCDAQGVYSGGSQGSSDSSSFNAGFCTGNDAEALTARWFRGVQTTDSEGLVFFKTCFPGWYPSRTSHIHFKVINNGSESLVSQFCFQDDLSNDIYLNHADYTGQAKDTLNSTDNVFGSDYGDYTYYVKKNSDNSMTAFKAIQLVS